MVSTLATIFGCDFPRRDDGSSGKTEAEQSTAAEPNSSDSEEETALAGSDSQPGETTRTALDAVPRKDSGGRNGGARCRTSRMTSTRVTV